MQGNFIGEGRGSWYHGTGSVRRWGDLRDGGTGQEGQVGPL